VTISREERTLRRRSLGSSDISAILGFQYPFRTAADVQIEKLHEVAEVEDSGAIRVGNVVERALCEYAAVERKLQDPVVYSPPLVKHESLPFHASLDAIAPARCVIEAKSTGGYDSWGTPGTDEVPDSVVIQATWQMAIVGLEVAIIPVMFTGLKRDVQIYEVRRDEDLVRRLFDLGMAWWEEHYEQRRPAQATPSLDVVKRVKRVPASSVAIDPRLVEDYRLAQKHAAAAKKSQDAAQARLLAALGDAEAGTDDAGEILVTYFERDRKAYAVEAGKYRAMNILKGVTE
jgi:predicted phage-related endonuclease